MTEALDSTGKCEKYSNYIPKSIFYRIDLWFLLRKTHQINFKNCKLRDVYNTLEI